MRIVTLTQEDEKRYFGNIMLKRSPNHYGEFEARGETKYSGSAVEVKKDAGAF